METERVELVQVNKLVEATNAVAVPNPIREELIRTLSPVAERMAGYEQLAKTLRVVNQAGADDAARVDKEIAADIKIVEGDDVLAKIIRGLDQLHGKAVAVRSLFVGPMKGYRKTIRQPVLDWEAAEKKKADDLARKLNAEAEAKAALERAKQEAEAQRQRDIESAALRKAEDARRAVAKAKGDERARLEAAANAADRKAAAANIKSEAKTEAAAAVFAPTVHVQAAKTGMRKSTAWTVKGINEAEFYGALVNNPSFRGFVEINKTRLARAKSANPSMEITGIAFEQVTR